MKRPRDRLVESQQSVADAEERGRKVAQMEYNQTLQQRDDTAKDSQTQMVQISMFEATAQELDIAQTKLAQTRADLEQERKRNMRLHRLRMAAEEEIEKAKETINIMSGDQKPRASGRGHGRAAQRRYGRFHGGRAPQGPQNQSPK